MYTKRIIAFPVVVFTILAVTFNLFAAKVENVAFSQDSKDIIHIYYDLSGPEGAKFYVSLKVSANDGKDFNIFPSSLEGDVGFNVTPDYAKHIKWNVAADFERLKGENFVFQVIADDENLPAREITNSKDNSVMVIVPTGKYTLGSDDGDKDEQPKNDLYINNFYIDNFEVTVSQFKIFCQETDKTMPVQPQWSTTKHPVVNVTWEDASEYSAWAKKRLPTEAEWEKAARANSKTNYCYGNDAAQLAKYAWYADNADSSFHPSGKKLPNSYGIFDMHGNIWEWCSDWYDENYYRSLSETQDILNPKGPETGKTKVLRGGGWSNDAQACRVSNRSWDSPDNKGINRGFRCVKDAK